MGWIPTFTSAAHTKEDLDFVIRVFKESVSEMAKGGLLSKDGSSRSIQVQTAQYLDGVNPSYPPREDAILAKDENGYPAWYVKDENGALKKI